MATRRKGSNGIAPVIEAPKGKAPRKINHKPCACGCGILTEGGDFRPGHDARLKGRLLAEARSGDSGARSQLIRRGWATNERIDAQSAKASAADVAARKQARLQKKAARLRAELLAIEAEIDALTSGQAAA